jgi:hypothetical protein
VHVGDRLRAPPEFGHKIVLAVPLSRSATDAFEPAEPGAARQFRGPNVQRELGK